MDFHEGESVIVTTEVTAACCLSSERDYGEVYGRSYEDDMVVSPDTEGP